MKKLTIFMVFVLVVCVFTGCNPVTPVTEENSTEPTEQTALYESLTDYDADVILPESVGFSWYKKPFFRATDMRIPANEIYNWTIVSHRPTDYGYHPTEYLAYYIGDNCGVINSYGEILTDALYSDPYFCPEGPGMVFRDQSLLYEYKTGEIIRGCGHGGGPARFYYDINSDEFISISGSEGENEALEYDKTASFIVMEAYMEKLEQYENFDAYDIDKTGKIGLYNNEKLVIPFDYVAAAEICEDVVAMYDGSMWTYFSVDGEVIMENVPTNDNTFRYYHDVIDENGDCIATNIKEINTVYSYSCGCVPVKKDAKWGYMDKNGEMIIDAVFDKALPAFEGRAWVCVDGYWGIIEI